MRVLFNTYPMAFDTPGGGERQIMAYYRHLPRHGIQPTLFNLWEPRLREHQLVHFFSVVGGSLPFCEHVKKIGLPLVVSSSLWITEETRDQYPVDEIRRQLAIADRVIVNSEMEGDQLSRVLDLPRNKFVTVYNGVDERFFIVEDPALFRSTYAIEGPFVLNVANVEPRKNQLALIRALRAFPDLKLVIIGHERVPPYAARCKLEAGAQLIAVGPLPYASPMLRSALAACEALVLPSTLETPGLAALEGAAAGAKVVVTKEGATREYFGDLVVYVDPLREESIIEGLTRIRSARPLAALSERIRARFTWTKTTEALADCYRMLASGRQAR